MAKPAACRDAPGLCEPAGVAKGDAREAKEEVIGSKGQLAISPQCGFSSDIELVQLPKDVRWRKFESQHCRADLKN
jgi:hypothetical protein